MPDGPGNPPPNPADPWLEGLTFEQVAQLVNEIHPDVFYQRASAFDQAGGRLQDVLDRVRHELNHLRETWTGKGSDDFDALAREVTAKASVMLQFLQNPGYGAILRNAGDVLAEHQRRLQDLQGQKAQQEAAPPAPGAPPPEVTAQANNDSAKQILRDLRTAYWDVGNSMAPLPFKPPQVVADLNGGGPPAGNDTSNGTPDPVTVDPTPQHVPHTNGADNPFAPPTSHTAVVVPPGSGPFLFGGGDGTLGKDQPSGQYRTGSFHVDDQGEVGSRQLVGKDEPGPFAPAPQQASESERPVEDAPAVLGQTGVPLGFTGLVPGVAGVVGAAGAPAVLGRSEKRADACRPGTRSDRAAVGGDVAQPDEERDEERQQELVERPETVSSEVSTTDEFVVRTAVDAPATPEAVPEEAKEKAIEVATAAGGTPLPEQVVAAAETEAPAGTETPVAEPEKPVVPVDTSALTNKPLAFSASAGGAGSQDLVDTRLDPEARGMFAPTATPDKLQAVQLPGEPAVSPAATAGAGRGPVDPYASQHMGGMPMTPMMMGGMSGGMSQQNGRMSAVPNEPRPEVWDPLTGAPIALGRREVVPEPDEKPREPELSPEQVQARLTEKFAELDRLLERGK